MQDFTIGDLGVFIGTIGGVITSILVIIQKSKCIKLDFLCCHCIRDINELKKEERDKKEKEDLIVIEVWFGDILDEEDIIRYEDIYDRN